MSSLVALVLDSQSQQSADYLNKLRFRNENMAFGVILVYDVSNKKSFANLQQWLVEVNEFASSDLPKLLIGKNQSGFQNSSSKNRSIVKTIFHEFLLIVN